MFATIRVEALFPEFYHSVQYDVFAVAYSLEYATLFGALGLLAMKLYEAAANVEKMITS